MDEQQQFHQVPNDLQNILQLHAYFNSVINPSEDILKCKAHLEEQLSKIITTIQVQIVRNVQ